MRDFPLLAKGLQTFPLDTASNVQKYVVQIGEGKQFEISEKLHQFIHLIDGKRSISEIAAKFSELTGTEYSSSDAERLIVNYLIPTGIFVTEPEKVERKHKSHLYLQVTLFTQEMLHPVTSLLHSLFSPFLFSVASIVTVLFHVYFYVFSVRPVFSLTSIGGTDILLGYLVILLTTLFHEVGHSSACHHYGAKHGAIGVGLYLCFPVFYADVSDVWKLKRTERAVVDVGGMFFQLLCVPVLYLFYLVLHNSTFLYAIYGVNFAVITALNPLLRYDGYWLVSDLFGVPNLRKRSQETLRYFLLTLFARQRNSRPQPLQIDTKAKYFLYTYSIASNLFFTLFLYLILKHVLELLPTYPSEVSNFFTNSMKEIAKGNPQAVLPLLPTLLVPGLMIVMLGMMVSRMISRIVRFVLKKQAPSHLS